MATSRYATSRQKACQECVQAKAKCDRHAIGCRRCVARRLLCVYPQAAAQTSTSDACSDAAFIGADDPAPVVREAVPGATAIVTPSMSSLTDTVGGQPAHGVADGILEVTAGELVCPIKADEISIRWMNAYVPTPDQTVKPYQPSTIAFLYRSLRAYSGMVVRGSGIPPFIHPAQVSSSNSMDMPAATAAAAASGVSSSAAALTTCLSLARICDTTLAGSTRPTAEAAAAVLKREMDRIYAAVQQQSQSSSLVDHLASLAAFQAYLIYALVLFFQLEHQGDPFLRQAIVALQEIACTSSRHGLVCVAEQAGACPRWAAWVVAEAKRRTLYVVYLFDSVLSAHDGLPTYLGTELRGLPAPGSKALWQAASLVDWNRACRRHLDEWTETGAMAGGYAGLCIDELWPYPVPADAPGLVRRRRRVDQWLESVDEYGTMMYAVTSSTHGG